MSAPRVRTRWWLASLGMLAAAFLPARLVAQSATLTGTITDARSGGPIAAARVSVAGNPAAAVTSARGVYRLAVTPGQVIVRIVAIGFGSRTDTLTIAAGETRTFDAGLDRSPINLQEIAVLGTRDEGRTVVSSPVPVDVLTAEDIKMSGRTETAQILQMLAPSFNFPRPSVTDGTDHSRPATLRGLAPDQVLVLVNGKRRHTSALINLNGSIGRGAGMVDLNAIPASAIERVEILRDGAAAQYGSDAIAGVINIVLKGSTANQFSIQGGEHRTTMPDPEPVELQQQVPAPRPAGQTITDGRNVTVAGNYALSWGDNGFITVSAEYRDRGFTNRSYSDARPQYFAGDPRNNDPNLTNQINHRFGDPESRDIVGFVNAARQVGLTTEFYATVGYGDRNGEAAGFFRRANDNRTVRAIHPNGFLPLIETTIRDLSALAGLRGTLGNTRYDLSLTYGRNSFDFGVNNSNNASLGAASPTSFEAGGLGFNQLTANLDLVRQMEIGAASPLNVAFGAEFRRDGYSIREGEPDSWRNGGVRILDGPNAGGVAADGAQVFPGFRPADITDESRSNVAAYLDLEVNPVQALLIGVAGRVENYSDFGSATTGKLAARLELTKGVAVRGAAATGFRAPSLGQSWFTSTATNFINGVPNEIKTFPVSDPVARLLGARDLEAETSVNLSGGVALNVSNNLSLTVDYYDIAIDDRIVLSGNFLGTPITTFLTNNGFPGVAGGRYFTNAIDTKTKGVDIILNYGRTLSPNSAFRLTAGYNANETEVTRVSSTPAELAAFQNTLFDRVERARIEQGQPRNNLNLMGVLDVARATFTLRAQRFGEVTSFGTANPPNPLDQTFAAKWLTDVAVGYRLTDQLTLTAGADNLFDVYPDQNSRGSATANPANNNAGIFPYNGVSPFGFNGRFIYARAVLTF